MIASSSQDGHVLLWDGRTGKYLRRIASEAVFPGFSGVHSVRFSPDGRRLLIAAVTSRCKIFDIETGKEVFDEQAQRDKTNPGQKEAPKCHYATVFSPDGKLAAASRGKELNLLDGQTGSAIKTLRGNGTTLRAAGFSADGTTIAWGSSPKYEGESVIHRRLTHTLRLPSSGLWFAGPEKIEANPNASSASSQHYARTKTTYGPWSVNFHRIDEFLVNERLLEISKDGQITTQINITDGDFANGPKTFTADGQEILIGTTGEIRAYDLAGKQLASFVGHDGQVTDMAPSTDGRLLVSASSDQTVRLWNAKTRELIVTLFPAADGEWIMWTPQGYFAASGPGAELIGWQINRGPEHAADYVTAAQLRRKLNRPDIVARAIELVSAKAAVREASGDQVNLAALLDSPVPRLQIIAPIPGAVLRGGRTEVEIRLDASPAPVKLVRVQVNGVQVAEHVPDMGAPVQPHTVRLPIALNSGHNVIRVTAANETGETSAEISVSHDGEGGLDKRGTLYLLAIGVDKYPNLPGNDLRYSGADARAFAEAIAARLGPLHERTELRVLVNGANPADVPTAANILNALGMLRQARENDTVVVFVAGHGANEGPNYRLLATDATTLASGVFLPTSVVPWYAFQETIESAKGRRILFLDTCHSGNAYHQRLGNDAYQANIIVYSAARWDQQALERADLGGGHGLFTYAAVEGIVGKAAQTSGAITTLSLRDFLDRRVRELSRPLGHNQNPQFFRGRDSGDYVLTPAQ